MTTTFTNVLNLSGSAMSIAYENRFLGENFGNYSRVKRITFNGIIDSRFSNLNNSGVKESLSTITGLASTAHDQTSTDFVINGRSFGKGRITSIDFSEKNNPIRMGAFTANLEIYESLDPSDEFSSSSSDPINSNLATAILAATPENIEDFGESFSFEVGEDDSYSYNHSLNLKYISGVSGVDYTQKAKDLAKAIYNTALQPDFGYTTPEYSGLLNLAEVEAGKHLYDESYDLINLNFSFSKKFSSINLPDLTFGAGRDVIKKPPSRSISRGQDGHITVTENGQIQSLTSLSAIEPWLVSVTGVNSATAMSCAALALDFQQDIQYYPADGSITAGTGPAGTGPAGILTGPEEGSALPLFPTPIEIGISKNKYTRSIDYSVSFSNNPRYTSLGILEFNYDIAEDINQGQITITERGKIRPYGHRQQDFDCATTLTSALANAEARLNAFLLKYTTANSAKIGYAGSQSVHPYEYFLRRKISVDYPKNGTSVDYNITYVNDGRGLSPAQQAAWGLRNMAVTISDTHPHSMSKNYMVPNRGEIKQYGNQTEISTRSISVQAQRIRTGNYLTSPPDIDIQLAAMLDAALYEALNVLYQKTVIIKETFVTGLSYSFESQTGKISMKFDLSWTSISSSAGGKVDMSSRDGKKTVT